MTCPTEWGTEGERAWWIDWRCGECGHHWESMVSNLAAEALDRDLARQDTAIRQTADAIAGELMKAEADTFIAALHRDLIDAADFA